MKIYVIINITIFFNTKTLLTRMKYFYAYGLKKILCKKVLCVPNGYTVNFHSNGLRITRDKMGLSKGKR